MVQGCHPRYSSLRFQTQGTVLFVRSFLLLIPLVVFCPSSEVSTKGLRKTLRTLKAHCIALKFGEFPAAEGHALRAGGQAFAALLSAPVSTLAHV